MKNILRDHVAKRLNLIAVLAALAALAALAVASPTLAVEPIVGSITYHGQPRTKLRKAPIGSPVYNSFFGEDGYRYEETYLIEPDRSLKLVERRIVPIPGYK